MVKLQPSVFLFIGNENYLKEKAISELKSSLLDRSSRELDYKVFYGSEASAREILDYAATPPFLAEKKLVVIKDFEKLADEDKSRLIAYITKPAKFTCLVLDAAAASAQDLRPVIGHIKVLRFDDLTDPKLRTWIKDLSASRGKRIEPLAIEALKESQGPNLFNLDQELEKLSLYIGSSDVIKERDVQDIAGKGLIKPVFDLAWAINEKDVARALRIASDLTSSGRRAHEIIGFLYWHLKRLLKAKLLQAKGESDSSIADILKVNKRYINEFFKQVRSCGLSRIKRKIEALLETDLDIKRTRLEPAILLEFAIIRLCIS